LIQNIHQAGSRMNSLAAEQDIGPGAVVKCKRNELASRGSRTYICDRRGGGWRSFAGHHSGGNTVAAKRRGTVLFGAGSAIVVPTTSAEHSKTGN
jgi:hypothetical protein